MTVHGHGAASPAPATPWPQQSVQAPPPSLPVFPPPPRRRRLTLGLSLLSTGLAAAALIVTLTRAAASQPAHPAGPPATAYTADQIAAAKTKTCAAWKRVDADLRNTTNRANPATSDDAQGWANVANTRAAYLSAALWLPTQVESATPPAINEALAEFAATAGNAAAVSLSGTKPDQFMSDVHALNSLAKKIEGLCS